MNVKIKEWTQGVPVEAEARKQLENVAALGIVQPHLAVMPDVHWGYGATVGSVIPTIGAVIPAAVGVDIGCGMLAVQTTLRASDLPDNLFALRTAIEAAVPHGRTSNGGPGDRGAWGTPPETIASTWTERFATTYTHITQMHPGAKAHNSVNHLGTLGTGNHFIEMCLDEEQRVWLMLHSGSRGAGNRIGSYFTALAQQDMKDTLHLLPDKNLAYFKEGSQHFDDYCLAVSWAQNFASWNRQLMMDAVLAALRTSGLLRVFCTNAKAVNCHHNYVNKERYFDQDLLITRKGAVSAKLGQLGIVPGSMGARSYITEGNGNEDSFCSCSHGAGRAMSRTEAKKRFTVEDHIAATAGVECRKDADVVDETPAAYKDIDAVMAAQSDLVSIKHVLKQVLCVKG